MEKLPNWVKGLLGTMLIYGFIALLLSVIYLLVKDSYSLVWLLINFAIPAGVISATLASILFQIETGYWIFDIKLCSRWLKISFFLFSISSIIASTFFFSSASKSFFSINFLNSFSTAS